MKREIVRPFNHGPFTWTNVQGQDRILSWGRLHKVPGEGLTSVEMVETTPTIFDEIALDPDIIVGEEIVDAIPT